MVSEPKAPTLKRYGLSLSDWHTLLSSQGGVCAVCQKEPGPDRFGRPGRLCIDHEHVKGWKKLKPEARRLYVRGLLCWFCNHYYVSRAITVEKSERVTAYLKAYLTRQRPGSRP